MRSVTFTVHFLSKNVNKILIILKLILINKFLLDLLIVASFLLEFWDYDLSFPVTIVL